MTDITIEDGALSRQYWICEDAMLCHDIGFMESIIKRLSPHCAEIVHEFCVMYLEAEKKHVISEAHRYYELKQGRKQE